MTILFVRYESLDPQTVATPTTATVLCDVRLCAKGVAAESQIKHQFGIGSRWKACRLPSGEGMDAGSRRGRPSGTRDKTRGQLEDESIRALLQSVLIEDPACLKCMLWSSRESCADVAQWQLKFRDFAAVVGRAGIGRKRNKLLLVVDQRLADFVQPNVSGGSIGSLGAAYSSLLVLPSVLLMGPAAPVATPFFAFSKAVLASQYAVLFNRFRLTLRPTLKRLMVMDQGPRAGNFVPLRRAVHYVTSCNLLELTGKLEECRYQYGIIIRAP
ncbi:hypothetical protein C8R47DRAFT_1066819 [Mycena vitilis]|nr:hypothetical protein C8R47DRAFT_1066819 [Mycena vitilis]